MKIIFKKYIFAILLSISLIISINYVFYFIQQFSPKNVYYSNESTPVIVDADTCDSKTLSMRFSGDIMLARYVETLISRSSPWVFIEPLRTLPPVDFTIINFESAMTLPHVTSPPFTFQFATAPQILEVLQYLDVTHASLANNHSFDYGLAGYEQTKVNLKERQIDAFGHPTVHATGTAITYIATDDGCLRIALVGLHTLFNNPTVDELQTIMSYAKQKSDLQFVYVHWGNEYELTSSQLQKNLAETLVSLGADMIVGHHPHVVQEIDIIESIPVFYSLGNYIFDQYFSPDVMNGLLIDVEVAKAGIESVRLLPTTNRDSDRRTRMMDTEEQVIFLRELADRSPHGLRQSIRAGKLSFNELD